MSASPIGKGRKRAQRVASPARRDQLIEAAIVLFAEKGFRATRVSDIEDAVGLAPRTGAFYRHFDGKEEILRAVVQRYADQLGAFSEVTELLPLGDLRAELLVVVRWALKFLRRQQPLLRLIQRDADLFPALLAEVHERLVQPGYRLTKDLFGELAGRYGDGQRGPTAWPRSRSRRSSTTARTRRSTASRPAGWTKKRSSGPGSRPARASSCADRRRSATAGNRPARASAATSPEGCGTARAQGAFRSSAHSSPDRSRTRGCCRGP